jgi:surface antigen
MKKYLILTIVTILCTHCTPQDQMNLKRNLGTVIGAGAGALAGSHIGGGSGKMAAIAGGTLLGAMIGNNIGAALDARDREYQNKTFYNAMEYNPIGVTSSWINPDTQNRGDIIPRKTFQNGNQAYCREFTQVIFIGNVKQEGFGTACRAPDGTWKIINSN